MSIPRTAVKHPVTTIMVFIALFAGGIISMIGLGQELFPTVNLPTIMVVTINPGVGPYDIESGITRKIESSVAGLNGVDSISSTSAESVSQVMINFVSGTDTTAILPEIREKINAVVDLFPEGTQRSMMYKFSASMLPSLTMIAYTGTQGIDIRGLLEDEVVPILERIPGVAQASYYGGREKAVIVELDLDSLAKLSMPITQIMQVFQGENVNLPAGSIKLDDKTVVLRTVGEFTTIEDVGEVLIGYKGNVPIFLRDAAEIKFDYLEQREFVNTAGTDGIMLMIRKQPEFNTVKVNEAVLAKLEEIKTVLPPSIKFEIMEDQADTVRASVGGVASAAWQGGILAIFALLIFLRNVKSTIIIGTVIPVAVISTLTLINFGGMTLNITSLMGITLAIGMFVDNAIVVLETIYRKQLGGLSRDEAAIQGAEEVAKSITASTLTTVAVFLPMLFVEGIAGILFQDLSLTISFSLLISLLSALTLIPVMCSKFLNVKKLNIPEKMDGHHELSLADIETKTKNKVINKIGSVIQNGLKRLDNLYESIIGWSLDHVVMVIVSSIILLVLSFSSIALLGMEFLPEADEGRFTVNFNTRVGSLYEYTGEKAKQIENIVREVGGDSIQTLASSIGTSGGGTGQSSSVGGGGSNNGSVYVTLTYKDQRDDSIWDIVNRIDRMIGERVLDVEYTVDIEGMSAMAASTSGVSSPIVIEISGDDLDLINDYAKSVRDVVSGIEGTRNVRVSHKASKPELQFRIKRREAVSLGLSPLEIAGTIRTAYNGMDVSMFSLDEDDYDVFLILKEDDRNDLSRINNLFFVNRAGSRIPMENVVEMVTGLGPVSISRSNRTRQIKVMGYLTGDRALNRVMEDIEEEMINYSPPPGIKLNFTGSGSEMEDSFESLMFALLIAVGLVYMVMASQFESLLNPFIVMFSIPFAIIGLVAALLLTNTTFSILAFVGAILLVGIVVNNAIVLLDYINILVSRGVPLRDAIIKGGMTRLKPILMTSITTILGLIPMSLGNNMGAELRSPIGRAVIGGLATSTLITLVLIPTVFWLIETKTKPYFKRIFSMKNDNQEIIDTEEITAGNKGGGSEN